MDIFEQLKLLEEQSNKTVKYYFYYDHHSLKIISIKNFVDNNDINPYIEISGDELPDTDISSLNNFKIIKTEESYKIIKKDKINYIDNLSNIKIQKIRNANLEELKYSYDLIITQDIKNKTFTFNLGGWVKEEIDNKNLNNLILKFYITSENRIDILYDTYEIKIKDLSNQIVINYNDEEINQCSILCCKYFMDYLHLVIE